MFNIGKLFSVKLVFIEIKHSVPLSIQPMIKALPNRSSLQTSPPHSDYAVQYYHTLDNDKIQELRVHVQ